MMCLSRHFLDKKLQSPSTTLYLLSNVNLHKDVSHSPPKKPQLIVNVHQYPVAIIPSRIGKWQLQLK